MRILIAEDDSLSRTLLERTLQRDGYDVIAVEDGARALQKLDKEDPPRLALLDWIMPALDGAQLCRELRTRKNKPYTYLILLSSKNPSRTLCKAWSRAPMII
jgi:DNA-binding response OmpR family regulator